MQSVFQGQSLADLGCVDDSHVVEGLGEVGLDLQGGQVALHCLGAVVQLPVDDPQVVVGLCAVGADHQGHLVHEGRSAQLAALTIGHRQVVQRFRVARLVQQGFLVHSQTCVLCACHTRAVAGFIEFKAKESRQSYSGSL